MTKSELIEVISARQSQLSSKDAELAVKTILEQMSQALESGDMGAIPRLVKPSS